MPLEWLNTAVQISVVAGFIGSVFTYVVLRPLNATITDLHYAIQDLRKDLRDSEERRHMMEIKLAEVDQRARVAHSRLDELVKYCQRNGANIFMHERMGDDNEGVERR
jgi:hypothetical protein